MNAIPSRFSQLLGLRHDVKILLLVIALIGAGEEMWVRFVPKYLEALGASVFVIGLYDGLKTLLGAVYAYPGGVIADRWGHRRALVAFTFLSAAGYAVVLLFRHWVAVICGMFLFLAWSTLSLPASFSLVAASLPQEKHSIGIGVQSLVRRLPVLAGPLFGGWLIDRFSLIEGIRIGLLVSIVLAGGAIFLQVRLHEQPLESAPRPLLTSLWKEASPDLRRLLFSDILIRFCERIPFAWVVIYAMNRLGMSGSQVGALIAVEMAAAIACYIPASYLADRYGKEPFVVATFVFFTFFPLALLLAHNFTLLLIAFVIRGLKEFGEPARKALIINFSPPARRGQTIGAYYLVRDVLVTSGSFLGAALWEIGPEANFLSAAVVGAIGTLLYAGTTYQFRRRLALR